MPAYDFECRDCGEVFEERHVITAIPEVTSCKCGAPAYRKMGTGGRAGLVTPNWNAYTSIRLPKNLKGIKGLKNDSSGRPQITGRQLEDRVLKETGFQRE